MADDMRQSVKVPVYEIKRYMDVPEVKAALEDFISKLPTTLFTEL
jgi:hypothetical protein